MRMFINNLYYNIIIVCILFISCQQEEEDKNIQNHKEIVKSASFRLTSFFNRLESDEFVSEYNKINSELNPNRSYNFTEFSNHDFFCKMLKIQEDIFNVALKGFSPSYLSILTPDYNSGDILGVFSWNKTLNKFVKIDKTDSSAKFIHHINSEKKVEYFIEGSLSNAKAISSQNAEFSINSDKRIHNTNILKYDNNSFKEVSFKSIIKNKINCVYEAILSKKNDTIKYNSSFKEDDTELINVEINITGEYTKANNLNKTKSLSKLLTYYRVKDCQTIIKLTEIKIVSDIKIQEIIAIDIEKAEASVLNDLVKSKVYTLYDEEIAIMKYVKQSGKNQIKMFFKDGSISDFIDMNK